MYDRFSEAARATVARAEAEAFARGVHQVEPEDVVVALAGYAGVAGSVLRAVAAEPALLREGIRLTAAPVDADPGRVRPLPLATTTAAAFSIAAREADGFRQSYIGTEHLLLGLLREPTGRVTALLVAVRRDPGMVRERVLDLVSSPGFVSPEAPAPDTVMVLPAAAATQHPGPALGEVAPSAPDESLASADRELREELLDEMAQLRAEIALLRSDIASLRAGFALFDSRDGRHIA